MDLNLSNQSRRQEHWPPKPKFSLKSYLINLLHFKPIWSHSPYQCMADLLFILFGFSCRGSLCWISSCFSTLVQSKPVKQEFSRTMILPPMVSALCLVNSVKQQKCCFILIICNVTYLGRVRWHWHIVYPQIGSIPKFEAL